LKAPALGPANDQGVGKGLPPHLGLDPVPGRFPAHLLDADVDRDPVQPGHKPRPALELAQVLEYFKKNFLTQVVDQVGPAGDPIDHPGHHGLASLDQERTGPLAAGKYFFDQFIIVI